MPPHPPYDKGRGNPPRPFLSCPGPITSSWDTASCPHPTSVTGKTIRDAHGELARDGTEDTGHTVFRDPAGQEGVDRPRHLPSQIAVFLLEALRPDSFEFFEPAFDNTAASEISTLHS